jgi:outer membrane lipoprotein SlyB
VDVAAPAPVVRTVYRDRVVTRTVPAKPRVVVKKRSTKKSVAIIGGSTVGGAVVGGLIGGKKGAVIGGVVAGTAGTVYDRKTRKKKVRID